MTTADSIIVLTHGFVFLGAHDEANHVIREVHNIRIWGHDQGIGALVMKGPSKETRLDACPDITYSPGELVAVVALPQESPLRIPGVGGDAPYHPTWRVVFADCGFVFAGEYAEDERSVRMTNTLNFPNWGTRDKGFGYLGLVGRTTETVTTRCGEVRLPKRSVVFSFPCRQPLG